MKIIDKLYGHDCLFCTCTICCQYLRLGCTSEEKAAYAFLIETNEKMNICMFIKNHWKDKGMRLLM